MLFVTLVRFTAFKSTFSQKKWFNMLCALCFVLLICKAKRSLESIKSHDSFNGPPAPSPEISHSKRVCYTKTEVKQLPFYRQTGLQRK